MIALVDKIYRRIAPQAYRKNDRLRRINQALSPWGGANLPAGHPFWVESMFKQPYGHREELEIRFNRYPYLPVLVRAGTADPNPFRQVFLEQQYREILELAPDAAVILDLGANVGYAAMWLAMMFPWAGIYAVEPLAENFARLQDQIEKAGLEDRVQTLEAAVSNVDGREIFYQVGKGFHHTGGSLIADAQHQQAVTRVQCLSLPSILDCFGLSAVDVLKLDVEGVEGKLFADPTDRFREIIMDCRMVAVEPHGRENFQIVDAFFSSLGWNSSTYSEIVSYFPGSSIPGQFARRRL